MVLKLSQNTHNSTHSYMYEIPRRKNSHNSTHSCISLYVRKSPKNMTRCSNDLKIFTTPIKLFVRNSSENYDKVLKWSQNTHNSTHSCMYGIHPKNMTRCSNDLKILTTLLIAL